MIVITACFRRETRWIDRRVESRIVHTRMGSAAASDLGRLVQDESVDALISTGFCGGLDEALRMGDVVLAETIRYEGRDVIVSPELLSLAAAALEETVPRMQRGHVVTVQRVATPEDKRALAEKGYTAVDMESGPLARWAADRGLPFLSIRTVLDLRDESIPFSSASMAWSVLRHPRATAGVARASKIAGRMLGLGVSAVVDAWAVRET